MTKEERIQSLRDFIFIHGDHCSDQELYEAQEKLDQLEPHSKYN